MIIIIDLFAIIAGVLIIFGTTLIGAAADYVFDALPEYIGSIFAVLFIVQCIKHIYLYLKQSKKGRATSLIVSCGINLLTESVRCMILSVFICNWLSSYNAKSFFQMIITGISFVFDIVFYGLIILVTEAASWYQVALLDDKEFLFFNLLGIVNTLVLLLIINIASHGQLINALQAFLLK